MDITFDWLYLLIPVISAFVGWGTNVVAVQMMFYPLRFVGIPPFLGWQGIIPANAVSLARKSTSIITKKLLNLRNVFEGFKPEEFATGNLGRAIDALTDQVLAETVQKYAAGKWDEVAEPAREQIRAMLRTDIEKVSVAILADVSENIESIIDLEEIVVTAAREQPKLIGDMFLTVGDQEFTFIRRSGAYFGALFGIVQLGAWILYPAWWVLPFFGFFVGYVTNWLALKLIFEPATPKRYGPFVVQGLFHKRQNEVAEGFSGMVSRDILNADNILAYMIAGDSGERLFGIIERHVGDMLERYRKNPMVAAMAPDIDWDQVKSEVYGRLREDLPKKPDGFLYIFASRAIDIYSSLFEKMTELDSKSFENILRPPFQKDEWKLIVAGAVLGFAAGVLQVVYIFGDSVS